MPNLAARRLIRVLSRSATIAAGSPALRIRAPLAGGATHCAEVAGGSQRLLSLTVIRERVDATVRSCGGEQTESLSGQDLDPDESCWFSGNNATSVVEIWQHRGCAELVSAYKCRFVHWKHARKPAPVDSSSSKVNLVHMHYLEVVLRDLPSLFARRISWHSSLWGV